MMIRNGSVVQYLFLLNAILSGLILISLLGGSLWITFPVALVLCIGNICLLIHNQRRKAECSTSDQNFVSSENNLERESVMKDLDDEVARRREFKQFNRN